MRLAILVFTSLLLSVPLRALAQATGEAFLITEVAMSGEGGAWVFAGGGDRHIMPGIGIGVDGSRRYDVRLHGVRAGVTIRY